MGLKAIFGRSFFYYFLALSQFCALAPRAKADRSCPIPLPMAVKDTPVPWSSVKLSNLPSEIQNSISGVVPQDYQISFVARSNFGGDKNAVDYLVFYNNSSTAQSFADVRQRLSILHSDPQNGVLVFSVFRLGVLGGNSELADVGPDDFIVYRSWNGAVYAKTTGAERSYCWEDVISWQTDRFVDQQIQFFTSDGFNYPVNSARYPADIQTVDSPIGNGWKIDQGFQDSRNGPGTHLGEDWNDVGGGNSDLGHPIFAVSRGEVIFAGDAGTGWNGIVVLRHRLPNIDKEAFSLYGHLNIDPKAKRADGSSVRVLEEVLQASSPGHVVEVEKGQLIGYIGPGPWNAKSHSYEMSHLHFEIIVDSAIAYDVYKWVGYLALNGSETQWTNPSKFINKNRAYWTAFSVGQLASVSSSTFQESFKDNGGLTTLGKPTGIVFGYSSRSESQPFHNGEVFYDLDGQFSGKAFAVLNPFIAKLRMLAPPRVPAPLPTIWGYNSTDISNQPLGLVVSDVVSQASTSSFGTVFKYQSFENGALEFHQTGKYAGEVFEVHGAIFKKWTELNFDSGVLGLPISDEYDWQGMRRSDFEGGYITWMSPDNINVILN